MVTLIYNDAAACFAEKNHGVISDGNGKAFIALYFLFTSVAVYSCTNLYSFEVFARSFKRYCGNLLTIFIVSPKLFVNIFGEACALYSTISKLFARVFSIFVWLSVRCPVRANRPLRKRDGFTVYGVGIAVAAGRRAGIEFDSPALFLDCDIGGCSRCPVDVALSAGAAGKCSRGLDSGSRKTVQTVDVGCSKVKILPGRYIL